jgi:indolepyruvate ferredoxin oxidoreductase
MVPTLNSAGVQEIIDYWLYGYALSRLNLAATTLDFVLPELDLPLGGLNIRAESMR